MFGATVGGGCGDSRANVHNSAKGMWPQEIRLRKKHLPSSLHVPSLMGCRESFPTVLQKQSAMPYRKYVSTLAACSLLLSVFSGCALRRNPLNEQLSASQLRSQELFAESSELSTAQAAMHQNLMGTQQQNQFLSEQLAQTQTQLGTANTRIDNLLAERGELKSRYAGRLLDTSSDPLITAAAPGGTVPGFQRDELTGLNRFPEAIHFDLGSAELRAEAMPVIKEFANQVNSGGAAGQRVLIVGHTDDQPIANGPTARQHPTNWHLSTDRADQVIVALQQLGVAPERMAAMGYSKFQPLENGTDETSRQRNRRVELYIVPDSSNVAFWDPVGSLN